MASSSSHLATSSKCKCIWMSPYSTIVLWVMYCTWNITLLRGKGVQLYSSSRANLHLSYYKGSKMLMWSVLLCSILSTEEQTSLVWELSDDDNMWYGQLSLFFSWTETYIHTYIGCIDCVLSFVLLFSLYSVHGKVLESWCSRRLSVRILSI